MMRTTLMLPEKLNGLLRLFRTKVDGSIVSAVFVLIRLAQNRRDETEVVDLVHSSFHTAHRIQGGGNVAGHRHAQPVRFF